VPEFRWRLSAESRYAEIRMPPGQLVAPKSDEGGRVAPARRTMLGDDGNQIGTHSALLAASKQLAAS
jgi:hypothetical protein